MHPPPPTRLGLADGQSDWHALESTQATQRLGVDPVRGLDHEDAAARLRLYGPNRPTPLRLQDWGLIVAVAALGFAIVELDKRFHPTTGAGS